MTESRHGPLRVGIGGPVGWGKTALVDALCKQLRDRYEIAVITNNIYTLVNTLAGTAIATQEARADDTGRHTTTGRALHRLPAGGWLLDTPGMRELQLADAKDGLDALFADIVGLARSCRFADCRHESEPGCAVRAAIEAGTLDADRLHRQRKLAAEEARNREGRTERLERLARERMLGKMVKKIMQDKRRRQEP